MKFRFLIFVCLLEFFILNINKAQSSNCDSNVPSYVVDLSGETSDTINWELASPPTRNGDCCGGAETNCIEFIVILSGNADILNFSYDGAGSGGLGQNYTVNCSDNYTFPDNVCIDNSQDTVFIAYCKNGNDNNGTYKITLIQEVEATGDIAVSNGCEAEISVVGLQESTITWETVFPGALGDFNSYLSNTSGEDTITVTPGLNPPSYIDVLVTGNQDNICSSSTTEDTVRVHFVSDKTVAIDPPGAAICADGTPATLTANVTGGAPPYEYLWSTGDITSSISVTSPGWYSVSVSDTTVCPEFVDSVYVSEHTSQIAVDAGFDQSGCIGGSAVTITGFVNQALGGIWTGGNGTYNPGDTILGSDVSFNYIPTVAEEVAGSVEFILTSYGNGDCPADTDTMTVSYFSTPVVNVGNDTLVCGSVNAVTFSGSVSVGSTTGQWTTSGTGTFSPNDSTLSNVSYIPSSADTSNGFVNITLISTNNAGCTPAGETFRLSFESVPTVEAGSYTPVCSNSPDFSLNASFTNAAGIDWSTTGTGTFAGLSDPVTTYTPSASDISNDSILINIETTGTSVCPSAQDSVYLVIHQLPVLTLPADETICASVNSYSINASLTGITSTGTWSSSGTGSFSPDNQTLNSDYQITSADTASGNVTLTFETTNNGACPVVTDNFTLTFDKVPIVDAGANKTGCTNNPDVTLDGTVINATGGYWVSNGTGVFSDSSDLNATYTPSQDDIDAGIVIFTLNSTGNGSCNSLTDVTSELIIPAPVVEAGSNETICANNASVTLGGAVTNGSGKGRWTTSGDGVFLPHDSTLTPQYIAGPNDLTSGNVKIYLTSIQNGYCLEVKDSLEVTITPAPTVTIGVDQSVCANNSIVPLSASYTVASGIEWSSYRGGSFASGVNADNTDYDPGNTVGFDTIYIQTTGNGLCNPAFDTMLVEITVPPIVDAGTAQTVCFNNPDVTINGTITGGSTEGVWSTLGNGSFDDATSLSTVYQLGSADTSEVKLVLTSINNGTCLAVTDTLVINVLKTPLVEAGTNQTVCANDAALTLNGNVLYASSYQWTTTGDGVFFPSDTVLAPQYLPGVTDTTNGNVKLNLTTVSDGLCFSEKDSMEITITNAPTVSIGIDQSVCANNSIVPLSASYTVASGIEWSSYRGGSFASGVNADNTDYDPGNTVGFDTIYIQTTGNGLCNPAFDTLLVEITVPPIVDAGTDQTVCFNNPDVTISGTITGGSTEGVWSILGNGSFDDATSLSTVYQLGSADTSEVKLVLTSINNGTCLAVTDTLVINVLKTPLVEAGTNQTVCANNATLTLNGNVLYASSYQWTTTGDGVFFPSDTVLAPQYLPGVADTTNGNVKLNLTTVSDGLCFSEKDSMEITITNAPTVSTGINQSVCANNSIVPLSANYTVASGIEWSSNRGGSFASGVNADNTDYEPGNTVGFDTIYIQTTGNGLCNPAYDTMILEITEPPVVNAGSDQTVCYNSPAISISGTVTGGSTEGEWSTLGDGSFDDASLLTTTYNLGTSDTSEVKLILTSINNGTCLPVTDTLTINVIQDPVVDAGLPQTICANNPNLFLDGFALRADDILWATPGDGTFVDDTLLITSYTPGVNDTSLTSITLSLSASNSCATVSDDIIISFSPAPFVDAGDDRLACNQENSIDLSGMISKGASTGVWTHNGDGSILDPTNLLSEYYFGANDTIVGSVTFTLTSTNNGGCLPVTDELILTIINAPLVDIGEDDTICFGASVQLTAHVEGGSGSGVWTTPDGTGFFQPGNTDTTVTYIPTAADEALGQISFIYTTTNNGGCQPAYDTKKIYFTVTPSIDAGLNQTVCSNNPEVTLSPNFTGDVNSWYWESTGTGIFVPSADTLFPVYYPSSDDTLAGTLYLRLVVSGACTDLKDSIQVSFYEAPNVNAGEDIYICEGSTSVSVSGNVSGVSSTGIWSTLGDGSFDTNPENLNNTYTLGASDLSNKNFRLVLTSTNNTGCLPVADTIDIFITTEPTIEAGLDQTICANDTALLQGLVVGGSGKGVWTSSGDGIFSPSDTTSSAGYIPGANDELLGTAWIKYTTISSCLTISDSLELTVQPAPQADAGANDTVCEGTALIGLNGNVTPWAQPGLWTTSGDGSFNNSNSLTPDYTFGVGDVTTGKVNLYLTSTNNGLCNAAIDTVEIVILKNANVNPGSDISICDNDTLDLNGVITGSSGTGVWSSTGAGSFTFTDSLQSKYIPELSDVAGSPITITLTTTNNGGCPTVSNNFELNVIQSPTADAGLDDTICFNNPVVSLSGLVSNAGGGAWSSLSTGTWSPNNTTLITDYEASLNELTTGSFPLILTTTANGICTPASDTVIIAVTDAPLVDAGTDKYVCQGTSTVFVSGLVTGNSTKGTWSTLGNGTFLVSPDSLQTVYRMSSADTATGQVNLVLTSRENGLCNPVTDTMTIFVTPVPTVNAGTDVTICANNDTIQLAGIIEDGTAGTWNIINGDGIFIPSKDSLNAKFIPGTTSKLNGEVELMLIATASCVPVRDTMRISITPAPAVFAGNDVLLCSDATSIDLSGQVSLGASTGQWSTQGTGIFDNQNALTTAYYPSTADTAAHGVSLVLTSTLNGSCLAVTDTIELSFGKRPVADFLAVDTACANENIVFTDASVSFTGGIDSWNYIIGTDTISAQNANYQFSSEGTQKVLLEIIDNLGCSDTISRNVVVPTIPVADFTYADNCEFYQVSFTNNSTTAVNWQWDFGNGQTSILENPTTQVYPLKGSYQGKLTIEDKFGCFDSIQKEIIIYPTPQAGFSANQFCEGLPASFYDRSEIIDDTIQSWFWDFGDGNTSTLQEPVHLFTSSDSSQILQVVSTNHCSDTASLWVAPVPKPSFQALPASGCTPLRINFQQDSVESANYQWDFGDGFSSRLQQPVHTFINNTDSVLYFDVKLIVETQSGCIDSVINNITVYPNPVVNFNLSAESICSTDTVVLTNTTLNATSFTWDFGDGSPVVNIQNTEHSFVNNLTSDAYFPVKLIAESTLGCQDSTIKYVRVFPLPDPEIISPDTVCHEEPVTLAGPSGGASYDWDFGTGSYESGGTTVKYSFTNTLTNEITYPIRLKYTSQEGCMSIASKDILVFPTPQAEFSLNKESGCSPYFTPQITNQSTGSVNHYWIFGDEADTLINDSQFNYNLTQEGNNPVNRLITMRAVNSVGCAATYQRSVTIYPEIKALYNSDTVGCSPLDIKFENLTTNARNSIWYFGDGSISTNTSPNHTFINFSDTNEVFNVNLIVTSAYGCKDTLGDKSVLVHPSPEALFTLDNSAGCSPFNAEIFNASMGATNYFWNFGDGTTTDENNTNISHQYINTEENVVDRKLDLVVVNQYLCTDTVSEFVTIYPEVAAEFTADTVGCSPLKSQFVNQSEGARHYNWIFGDGNTSTGLSPTHTYVNLTQQPRYLSAKLITLSEYLCSDTAVQQIVVYNTPAATFTISDNAACAPYNIELTDSTQGVENFYWDFGDGITTETKNFVNSHLFDHEEQEPQIHDVKLVVDNEFQCYDTVSHTVTIYPKVEANFAPIESGCSPLTIDFVNLSDNVLTYDWNFGEGGVSGLVNPQHTFINQGVTDTTVVVTLIAESHFYCSDTFQREISVYASPDPDFIPDPSFFELPNTTVKLTNTTPGEWKYQWDFADGTISDVEQPGEHTFDTYGDFKIVLSVTSLTHPQCNDTVSHTIRILPGMPVADYDSSFAGCAPLTVSFINKSIGAGWFEWDFGDGGRSDDENPTYTFMYPGSYVIRLKAFSVHGSDEADKHKVEVYESPKSFFQIAPKIVTIPDPMITYNLTDNGVEYKWDFGDGNTSEEANPVHYYDEEGTYTISLMAWSEYGCFDSIVKVDEVIVEPGCKFLFPNAFTPSDAPSGGKYDPGVPELTNDIFHPLYNNITDYHLEVYNRWGELIFVSNDITIGWDGTYQNNLAQQGVYIWKATGRCINGKLIQKQGSVTLLR